MESYLTRHSSQVGLSLYLSDYKYSSVTFPDSLFNRGWYYYSALSSVFDLYNHQCVYVYTYGKEKDHHTFASLLIIAYHLTLATWSSNGQAKQISNNISPSISNHNHPIYGFNYTLHLREISLLISLLVKSSSCDYDYLWCLFGSSKLFTQHFCEL